MNKLTIRWIGQSGYILSDGQTTLCIDPYLSDVVNRVAGRARMVDAPFSPDKLRADAIVCTHNHLDHVDIDAIPLMDKEHMSFYAPTDCKQTLTDLGVTHFVPFDEGVTCKIGAFELCAVFADHTVPSIGVMVTYGDTTMYFTGDTYYNQRLTQNKCDILFICINGKLGNMDVNDAIKLANEIAPTTAVPNHYGMFESNTEDPMHFTALNSFIMEFNKEYEVKSKCLI